MLDVRPPGLPRRGAAAAARNELSRWPEVPAPADLLRRHGLMRPTALKAMGLALPPAASRPAGEARAEPVRAAGWLADPGRWAALRVRLGRVVAEHSARDPLAPGMPLEAARTALGLPDRRLVEALAAPPSGAPAAASTGAPAAAPTVASAAAPPEAGREQPGPSSAVDAGQRLAVRGGYVCLAPATADGGQGSGPRRSAEQPEPAASPGPTALPERVAAAVRTLLGELAVTPFGAPEANRLRELGLDRRALAAAERAGLLLRISPEIVLAPGADVRAARLLARLPQPFTTAQARQALYTTRRVAIPLLEYLDRAGVTQRLPDDRRAIRGG